MRLLAIAGGLLIVLVILWDAFEAVVLPRRVTRRLRLIRLVGLVIWRLWTALARRLPAGNRRETYLSYYGPLLLILILVTWAGGLVVGFALVQWGLGSRLSAPEGTVSFATDLYMSGTTFFTLGLGDVAPLSWPARAVTVVEAGTGFGFLALVIGYLPVFYQAFSRRETQISMLDAWAGSPPTAAGLMWRLGRDESVPAIAGFLQEWEHWSAELLESHLSYPILAFFRSQHGNQSWLAGLTMVLDTCALVLVGVDGAPKRAAWLTFANARHVVVDLCQVFDAPPRAPPSDRLSATDLVRLRAMLREVGVSVADGPAADARLAELRRQYEPYVNALANRLLMPLPPWLPEAGARDNWERSAWH